MPRRSTIRALLAGAVFAVPASGSPARLDWPDDPVAAAATAAQAAPAAAAATDQVEEPWVSLSGSGLFAVPDAAILGPRRLNLDLAFENQDRDPLRLDVLDLSVRWNYGLGHRAETYGNVVLSRAVAVAERPTLFVPPVDIVLQQGAAAPSRPYYPLYAPFPYVNRNGTSQIARFVPGDLVLGGKMRLVEPAGWRPAVAVGAELKLPLMQDISRLQAGAGTGGFDQTVRVSGEWRRWREALVGSLAFVHVGAPPFGDRVIVAEPGGGSQRRDEALRLPDRVLLGIGVRHVLSDRAALVVELTRVAAVGGRSPALYASGPLDLTAGGQLRWKRLHFTLGLRYHVNTCPRLTVHQWPLGGFADMTSVSRDDLRRYLTEIGASGALGDLRDFSQIAVQVPADGPPLPAGARVISSSFAVRAHDQVATVFVWGWSFGGPRGH